MTWTDFKKYIFQRKNSRDEAKGRLQLVLAHDRTGLDGAKLQEMRKEIAEVISKYVSINSDSVEIEVQRLSRESSQLTVSSPVDARGASTSS